MWIAPGDRELWQAEPGGSTVSLVLGGTSLAGPQEPSRKIVYPPKAELLLLLLLELISF